MTKKQIETIIQENMQKYIYIVLRDLKTLLRHKMLHPISFWSCFVRIEGFRVMKQYMDICGVLPTICVKIIGGKVQKKGIRKFLMILKAPAVFLLRKIC